MHVSRRLPIGKMHENGFVFRHLQIFIAFLCVVWVGEFEKTYFPAFVVAYFSSLRQEK